MILHLERKFVGKTETFIANQINALPHIDHYAFTVHHIDCLEKNVQVFSPPFPLSFWNLRILSSAYKRYFEERMSQLDIKLIHSHFLTDASFFHPLTKKMNIPKVCSCYGYDVSKFPKKYGFFSKAYVRRIFKEYDMLLAMSDDMAADLINLGCPKEKIKIHYHGVDTAKFDFPRSYNTTNRIFNLLSIGRLEPKKGYFVALTALRKIRVLNPDINIKYTIVGEGHLEKELHQYVIDNNLADVVDFKGYIKQGKEFNEILYSAHIFLLPSIRTKNGDKEGIPGTIVEAMASGLPVISTYHAGIPHVIRDGITGILLQEYDSDGIANSIVRLYYDENRRQIIGQNAKKYAEENLDLYIKAADLEDIYKCLIERT